MPRPKYESGMKTAKERMSEAFWNLLEKLPYDQISVLDISRVAKVNKNTFYYHYEDMNAMTREVVENVLAPDVLWSLLQKMAIQTTEAEHNNSAECIDLDERFKRLCLLAGEHATPWLRSMLKDAILYSWANRFSIDLLSLDEDNRLFLEFTLGGILEIMTYSSKVESDLAFARIAAIGSQMGLVEKFSALAGIG